MPVCIRVVICIMVVLYSLLHELGHRVSDKYDPETFVVKQETNNVREFVAPITEEELQNPHIAYFDRVNPGWKKVW